MGGFAWVTLATNDSYSLGALVVAHSLRRVGTPHDLVALVTPGVSASMRNQLSTVFTLVQEVNVLDSRDEANLALLERPDLGITFTKLHCWRLTQYEKCVFLDADTLVLKNCDELFEREELSAAPDPGWPDCFNSGVFVYRPSLDTFNALIKFALSKGSFDGGDQGLLNMFFSDWATKDISRHLPFIYNMVSTATYSYLPAYKQFGEDAKIAHFIGSNKPWLQYFDSETRLARSPSGSEHLQNLLQLWWDIFCSTVHPSLSPEMAHRSSFETQVDPALPTVSNFIIDLFQRLQPMSMYSEYQPISITPYVEDPSLDFWDPWENFTDSSKQNIDQFSHINFPIYHGSEQQHKAFENDKRQSGWHEHESNTNQNSQNYEHFQYQTEHHQESRNYSQEHYQENYQDHHQHHYYQQHDHQHHHQHHDHQHHHQHHDHQHHHQHHDHHQQHDHQHHHQQYDHHQQQTDHHDHQHHHNHQHDQWHHQPHQHEHHHEHNSQQTKQNTQYHIYNVPPPVWESENQQHGHGDHQDHKPYPDPPPPESHDSNSEYVKVTNESECLVAQPTTEEMPKDADSDLGLAGALAQLTLGVARSAEQTAFEEHMRKQAWEQGSMDYMGRDSFDNIWRKISETLAQAPSKPEPEPEPVPEPQKAATAETPSIKPTPESELPVLKPTEPLASTIPTTGSGDAQEILSSTAEPIATVLQSTQDTEPSSVSALPPSSDIVPQAPSEAPAAPPVSEEAKVLPAVPHTPLVTEATPPTSPPIMPTPDAQALKVVVPTPETPPVQEKLIQTQPPAGQEITPPVSEQSVPVQEIPLTEAKPVLPVSQQESVAPDASLTESKSADVTALPQQPPTTQEVPVPETKVVDQATPPPLQSPPPPPVVPSTPVEQPPQQIVSPVAPISQAQDPAVAEIKQPQTLAQISSVAEKAVVPPTCAPPTPEQIIPLPYTPVETKVATESVPQSQISEAPSPPTIDKPVTTELTSSVVQETKPATSLPDVPKPEIKSETSVAEVPKTETKPETSAPEVPKTETKPEASVPEVPKTETKPETSVPEVPKTETKPETSVPEVPKPETKPVPDVPKLDTKPETSPPAVAESETKPSVEQPSSTTQSQVKSEEVPKSEPVKQTPPQTPEASPSDQAPVPPKRRGHKGSGTSTEQGASSKPQSQQSKSSKSGQKGKK